MINYLPKQQGSTFIEALITVSLVGVGALSVVNLQNKLIRASSNTYQYSQAIILARSKMEEMRLYSTNNQYNTIKTGSDKTQGVTSLYTTNWVVIDHTNPGYKDVSIQVSWEQRDLTKGSVNIRSKISLSNLIKNASVMAKSTLSTVPNSDEDGKDNKKNDDDKNCQERALTDNNGHS